MLRRGGGDESFHWNIGDSDSCDGGSGRGVGARKSSVDNWHWRAEVILTTLAAAIKDVFRSRPQSAPLERTAALTAGGSFM